MNVENGRKIALVGTSKIGKTTIFLHFKEELANDPRVAFVEEAAREYFTRNPNIPILERFSLKPQGEIQSLAMQNEQTAHSSNAEVILCDRSVLDAVVYVKAHGDKKGSKQLLERVRHWIPTYHTIFLLDPTGIPYTTDDVRKETSAVRQRNHDTFVELFSEEKIPHKLLSGTLQERIETVQEVVVFKR